MAKPIENIPKEKYVYVRSLILYGNSYGKEIFKRLREILSEAVDLEVRY
jgi:hypothetical protein